MNGASEANAVSVIGVVAFVAQQNEPLVIATLADDTWCQHSHSSLVGHGRLTKKINDGHHKKMVSHGHDSFARKYAIRTRDAAFDDDAVYGGSDRARGEDGGAAASSEDLARKLLSPCSHSSCARTLSTIVCEKRPKQAAA